MPEGFEKIERLLALLLLANLKGSDQTDKILALKTAGFANQEIADLLSTSAGVVAQQLYARKTKKKPGKLKVGRP